MSRLLLSRTTRPQEVRKLFNDGASDDGCCWQGNGPATGAEFRRPLICSGEHPLLRAIHVPFSRGANENHRTKVTSCCQNIGVVPGSHLYNCFCLDHGGHQQDEELVALRKELARTNAQHGETTTALQERIGDLEDTVSVLQDTTNQLLSEAQSKKQLESSRSILQTILTMLSVAFGGGGASLLQDVMDNLVAGTSVEDHGAASLSSTERTSSAILAGAAKAMDYGIQLSKGDTNEALKQAIDDGNVLAGSAVAAVLVGEHVAPLASSMVIPKVKHDAVSNETRAQRLGDSTNEPETRALPVHEAVKSGVLIHVEEAIDKFGIDAANQVDPVGRSALDVAALSDQLAIVRLLEDRGGQYKLLGQPHAETHTRKQTHAAMYE